MSFWDDTGVSGYPMSTAASDAVLSVTTSLVFRVLSKLKNSASLALPPVNVSGGLVALNAVLALMRILSLKLPAPPFCKCDRRVLNDLSVRFHSLVTPQKLLRSL